MRIARPLTLTSLIILAGTAATSGARAPSTECDALRCTCVGRSSVAEKRARAREVFRGRVLEVKDTVMRWPPGARVEDPARVVTLVVSARWKGVPADTTRVWTWTAEGMCGVAFAEGEDWLVFVEEEGRRVHFSTRECDGTQRVDRAAAELRALGAPLVPPGA